MPCHPDRVRRNYEDCNPKTLQPVGRIYFMSANGPMELACYGRANWTNVFVDSQMFETTAK